MVTRNQLQFKTPDPTKQTCNSINVEVRRTNNYKHFRWEVQCWIKLMLSITKSTNRCGFNWDLTAGDIKKNRKMNSMKKKDLSRKTNVRQRWLQSVPCRISQNKRWLRAQFLTSRRSMPSTASHWNCSLLCACLNNWRLALHWSSTATLLPTLLWRISSSFCSASNLRRSSATSIWNACSSAFDSFAYSVNGIVHPAPGWQT